MKERLLDAATAAITRRPTMIARYGCDRRSAPRFLSSAPPRRAGLLQSGGAAIAFVFQPSLNVRAGFAPRNSPPWLDRLRNPQVAGGDCCSTFSRTGAPAVLAVFAANYQLAARLRDRNPGVPAA